MGKQLIKNSTIVCYCSPAWVHRLLAKGHETSLYGCCFCGRHMQEDDKAMCIVVFRYVCLLGKATHMLSFNFCPDTEKASCKRPSWNRMFGFDPRDVVMTKRIEGKDTYLCYKENDMIHYDLPTGVICDNHLCGRYEMFRGSRFGTCSSCRIANYCSKDCQRVAWKHHHKAICRFSTGNDRTAPVPVVPLVSCGPLVDYLDTQVLLQITVDGSDHCRCLVKAYRLQMDTKGFSRCCRRGCPGSDKRLLLIVIPSVVKCTESRGSSHLFTFFFCSNRCLRAAYRKRRRYMGDPVIHRLFGKVAPYHVPVGKGPEPERFYTIANPVVLQKKENVEERIVSSHCCRDMLLFKPEND